MADMTRIKKLLSQSTTMPAGTGLGGGNAQPSTLLNMHTQRGGCSCCAGGRHEDDEDEED